MLRFNFTVWFLVIEVESVWCRCKSLSMSMASWALPTWFPSAWSWRSWRRVCRLIPTRRCWQALPLPSLVLPSHQVSSHLLSQQLYDVQPGFYGFRLQIIKKKSKKQKQTRNSSKKEYNLPFLQKWDYFRYSCMSWVIRNLILVQPQNQFMMLNKACDCREARVSFLYLWGQGGSGARVQDAVRAGSKSAFLPTISHIQSVILLFWWFLTHLATLSSEGFSTKLLIPFTVTSEADLWVPFFSSAGLVGRSNICGWESVWQWREQVWLRREKRLWEEQNGVGAICPPKRHKANRAAIQSQLPQRWALNALFFFEIMESVFFNEVKTVCIRSGALQRTREVFRKAEQWHPCGKRRRAGQQAR